MRTSSTVCEKTKESGCYSQKYFTKEQAFFRERNEIMGQKMLKILSLPVVPDLETLSITKEAKCAKNSVPKVLCILIG